MSNSQYANRISQILTDGYAEPDVKKAMLNALVDLRHLANQMGVRFQDVVHSSYGVYWVEQEADLAGVTADAIAGSVLVDLSAWRQSDTARIEGIAR